MKKLVSFYLVATSFLILLCCDESHPKKTGTLDPSAAQTNAEPTETAEPFFMGDSVYRSKHLIKFSEDSLYCKVERFAIARLDTITTPKELHAVVTFTDTTKTKVANTTYYYFVHRGEQYKVSVKGSANVWLNASSALKPEFTEGKMSCIELAEGEAYVENMDAVAMNVDEDSLRLVCSPGSAFNVRDYHNEPYIDISIAKGFIKIKAGNGTVYRMAKPGRCLRINRKTKAGTLYACDTLRIGDWREARWFRLDDADLPITMQAIDRWYKTTTIYRGAIPDKRFDMGFSYKTPIDTVLKLIGIAWPVQVRRNRDSIIISAKSNHE